MKVKELQELLVKCDGDSEIKVYEPEECDGFYDIESVECEFDLMGYEKEDEEEISEDRKPYIILGLFNYTHL